jgi:catechol 2,3-dioxygenase-like lactoylglutathione lyase family enzyme
MCEVEALVEASLYVKDLDAAEAFYRDVLGLAVIGKVAGRHVFFRVGGGVLLVFDPRATRKGDTLPSHGAEGPGHVALGIRDESLAGWRGRLEARGVAVEKEVEWPRGATSIYFRDPSGNSVELLTPGLWGLASGW